MEPDDDLKPPDEVAVRPGKSSRVDWDSQPLDEARRLGRYFEKKEGVSSVGEERYRHQLRGKERTVTDRDAEIAELKSELDAAKAKSMHPGDWRTVALEYAVAAEGLAPGKSAKEIAAFLLPRAEVRDGVVKIAGPNGKLLPSVRLALLALDPDLLAPISGSGGRAPNPYVATQTVNPLQKALDSQAEFERRGKELGVRK